MTPPIGHILSPILEEIEGALMNYKLKSVNPPEFTNFAFRAATLIFMDAVMDKMWTVQEAENMSIKDREAMATKCGEDLRKFVKTYTGIDTHELYNVENSR